MESANASVAALEKVGWLGKNGRLVEERDTARTTRSAHHSLPSHLAAITHCLPTLILMRRSVRRGWLRSWSGRKTPSPRRGAR